MSLTLDDAKWLLKTFHNPLVRIDPRSTHGMNGPGWGRGRLLGLKNDETAIVQPMKHKKTELIELRYLSKWNSKNEMNMILTEGAKQAVEPLTVKMMSVIPKSSTILRTYDRPKIVQETLVEKPFIGRITDPVKTEEEQPESAVLPMKRKWTKITDDLRLEAKMLQEAGKSVADIAIITGLSKTSICRILDEWATEEAVRALVKNAEPADPVKQEVKVDSNKVEIQTKSVQSDSEKLIAALKQILNLPVSDPQKLAAIEALIK